MSETEDPTEEETTDVPDDELKDFEVQMSMLYPATGVENVSEAASIVIETVRDRLDDNNLDHIDVTVGGQWCPECGNGTLHGVEIAGRASVEAVFETVVYNAANKEEAYEVLYTQLIDMIEKDIPATKNHCVELTDTEESDDDDEEESDEE